MKTNESMYEIFNTVTVAEAKGKKLDILAHMYGIKRKKKWWIFKERDNSLRFRVTRFLKKVCYDIGTC